MASFYGLYSTITHLHVLQWEPASQITHIFIHFFSPSLLMTGCLGNIQWRSKSSTSLVAGFIFLVIRVQIWAIQLLISTEKFSPLPGFEPGTSPVLSWYVTNWAILAWITCLICLALFETCTVKYSCHRFPILYLFHESLHETYVIIFSLVLAFNKAIQVNPIV